MSTGNNKNSFYPYFEIRTFNIVETDKETNLPKKISLYGAMSLPFEKVYPFLDRSEDEGAWAYPHNGILFVNFDLNDLKDPKALSTAILVQQISDFIKADSFTLNLDENIVWFNFTLNEKQSKKFAALSSEIEELKNQKQKLVDEMAVLQREIGKKENEEEKLSDLIREKREGLTKSIFG
jgi:hypothetical protein